MHAYPAAAALSGQNNILSPLTTDEERKSERPPPPPSPSPPPSPPPLPLTLMGGEGKKGRGKEGISARPNLAQAAKGGGGGEEKLGRPSREQEEGP